MAKRKSDKIIRIQFSKDLVMMFGNSYKPWEMQFEEYLQIFRQHNELANVEQVTVSDNAWVSWGGLKWCAEKNMQHQFNREGCQSNEKDNQNPRMYDEMEFYQDSRVTQKVNELIEKYQKR
ncbi:spore protein H [Bacillus sp. NPDC094106]|uniref:spore protein H n=1 Tax=Bacillus sp. NPDC094106 TaxID=3363949 RepID=UPI003827D330